MLVLVVAVADGPVVADAAVVQLLFLLLLPLTDVRCLMYAVVVRQVLSWSGAGVALDFDTGAAIINSKNNDKNNNLSATKF